MGINEVLEKNFNEILNNKMISRDIKICALEVGGYLKNGEYTTKIPYMCRPQVIKIVKCKGNCMSCILLNICENDGMEA